MWFDFFVDDGIWVYEECFVDVGAIEFLAEEGELADGLGGVQ